jgi:hypothetical protein
VDPVDELRKRRARTQAALVEYMQGRKSAPFQDIAHHVHDDVNASENTTSKNI